MLAPSLRMHKTDCLSCHGDATYKDDSGHNPSGVDGQKFSASIHGSLKCNDCHADIQGTIHIPSTLPRLNAPNATATSRTNLRASVHPTAKSIRAPVATADAPLHLSQG